MDKVFSSDVAFTPTVKAIQTRKGSRRAYANQEVAGAWMTQINDDIRQFIEDQRSVFLGSANAEGQPYIQHRGGPAGFIKVIDPKTLGFVDFKGNRQFITQGNLSENARAHLFLIDYLNQRRVKIWGTARNVEGDNELIAKLMPESYKARPEQVLLFTISALDVNCPQHIPQRFEAEDVASALASRDKRIAALETELAILKDEVSGRPVD